VATIWQLPKCVAPQHDRQEDCSVTTATAGLFLSFLLPPVTAYFFKKRNIICTSQSIWEIALLWGENWQLCWWERAVLSGASPTPSGPGPGWAADHSCIEKPSRAFGGENFPFPMSHHVSCFCEEAHLVWGFFFARDRERVLTCLPNWLL